MTIAEKLTTIAKNEQNVYGAGFSDGYSDGCEDGKHNEREAFWNAFTANGTRTDFSGVFKGKYWSDSNFNPTLTIAPKNGSSMFEGTSIENSLYTDKLDLSKCTSAGYMFGESKVKKLKTIDLRAVTSTYGTFSYSDLESIDAYYPQTKTSFSFDFDSCSNLTHCIFCSEVAKGGLDMSSCKKLDKESLKSIIQQLSPNTSGLTVTLSHTAVDYAFIVGDYESGDFTWGGASFEWFELTHTRPNWTISLV